MEPKKNPKADLKQWSGVYFLAGLAFMLFLSWQAVEWKSYDRDLSLDTLNVGDDLDEDIPITELLTPPPPPPVIEEADPRKAYWPKRALDLASHRHRV